MAKQTESWARFAGKGIFPVEYASTLLSPWRKLILPPSALLRCLRLKPTDNVLEIGCGPGYFSPAVAKFLSQGTLTLFDYQDGMLDIAETRLKKAGLTNYVRRRGDAKALPFAENSFDAAFMVTVLGEVGDADACLREALRVLKPEARLSITEMFGDPDFVPWRILKQKAANAGLVFEESFGPALFYTCNFRKAASR